MFNYYLEIRFARKDFEISQELESEIINVAIPSANTSLASIRNNRKLSYVKRLTDYSFLLTLSSKDKVNPTRSVSSLSHALMNGEYRDYISENAMYNGCVLQAKLVEEGISTINNVSNVDIVAAVTSILFTQIEMRPKEKDLARKYEIELRNLMVKYFNDKNEL